MEVTVMLTPLKWFLAIIVVAVGIFFIVGAPLAGVISGTAEVATEVIVGIILIIAALVLRPR